LLNGFDGMNDIRAAGVEPGVIGRLLGGCGNVRFPFPVAWCVGDDEYRNPSLPVRAVFLPLL
jgi:hypothetical protein